MVIVSEKHARWVTVLAVCSLAAPAAMAADLDVSADTPDVSISTRPAGRNFLRLPALRFNFMVAASCSAAAAPVSFSLSVADTRVSMDAERLQSAAPVEFAVTIPASQIGPVAVEEFCARDADAADTEQRVIRIPSVLSAQASLLCESDSGSEMTYASESLDVTLHCEVSENEE